MDRFTRIVLLIAFVAIFAPNPAVRQDFEFDEFHTWTDIATIYHFSDQFRYDGDYGLRGVLTDENWSLLYLRPSVRYQSRPWLLLHGGAALFYNFFEDIDDLPELRPWVGLRIGGPSPGGFAFSNYFRLELRAFHLTAGDEWDAVFRARWQLQVTTPRFQAGSVEKLYALTSIEAFQDIGSSVEDTFGDRFRYNIGIGKQFNRMLRIDLNYLFHRVRIIEEDGRLDADDHVVRLRFFYRFS